MKILLLVTAFNSFTQAVYARFRDRGDEMVVAFAINEMQMQKKIETFEYALLNKRTEVTADI